MGNAICPNCKARLGCSCQLRNASNGKPVCTRCKAAYENTLKVQRTINPKAPIITQVGFKK